jgi:hypothetical protein
MSEILSRRVRVISSDLEGPQARRKSVEDVPKDDRDGSDKRPQKTGGGDTRLPPNENLRKILTKLTAIPRYLGPRK